MRYIVYNSEDGQIVRHGEAGTPRECALQMGLSLVKREVGLVPHGYDGFIDDESMMVRDGSLVKGEVIICDIEVYSDQ